MLVQPEDLITELYTEITNEISRENREEIITQIKAAEDFIKGYLFKYDLNAIFGNDEIEPSFIDEGLKKCVKIVASYWLVRKANPNVNYEIFQNDFNLMIGTEKEPGWIIQIKNGHINPDWPYKVDDPNTVEDESQINNEVYWTSNNKRTNHF